MYFNHFFGDRSVVLLAALFFLCCNGATAQCPVSNNSSFNYVANMGSSGPSNWTDASTWTTPGWVNPKIPSSTGNINSSVAINGTVTLNNTGSTIGFMQATTICGNLKVTGNMAIGGGCSPLNVYGKLEIYGNLTSGQSIKIWPGGEIIVYGNWNITGGANVSIDGTMAVKGDVDNKQGLSLSTTGNLFIFGDYKAVSGSNNINGNVVIVGDLNVPTWYNKGGTGDIYAPNGGSFGSSTTKGQADLEKNKGLYDKFQNYEDVFGLAPLAATISFLPSSPVCNGTLVTYTALPADGTGYQFFVNSEGTPRYTGSLNHFSYVPVDGDKVRVVVTRGASSASTTSTAIQVLSAVALPTALSLQSMCSGSTLADLSITPAVATSIYWFSDAVSNVALTSTTPLNSTIYYAEARGTNGCSSARLPISVVMRADVGPPAITATTSEPSCTVKGMSTTQYIAAAANATDFTWSISDAAAGTIGASSGIMNWNNGFYGTLKVKVTANGCHPIAAERNVTVYGLNPGVILVDGSSSSCFVAGIPSGVTSIADAMVAPISSISYSWMVETSSKSGVWEPFTGTGSGNVVLTMDEGNDKFLWVKLKRIATVGACIEVSNEVKILRTPATGPPYHAGNNLAK